MSRYQSSFKYRRNAKLSKLLEPAIAQDEPNDSLPRVSSATTRLPDTQPDAEEPFISPYIGLRRIPLLRKGCEICGDFGTVPWHCNLTEIAELRRSADAGCQSCDILRQGYDKCRERNDADRISVDVGREFFLKMQIYNDGIVMYLAFHVKRGEPALEVINKVRPWRAIKEFDYPVSNVTPHACARIIRSSMSRCEKEHEKCRLIVEQSGETAGFVPTRLIYVGSDVPADSPILFESSERSEHDPTPPPFTALSHCWGKTQIITTTKRTVALRRAGIPWSALSKTFQDAIELTRALGIDYIWIDSLCIIQDDVEDWAREATKMASIYRNAYLTIGATAAADGSHGLYPRERPIIHSIQATKNDTSFPIYIWRLPDAPDINNSWTVASEDCPLQLRAWTFQEQLLSPRFVHFTREEVVWECYETATCECDRIENVKWPDHHMFKAEVLRVDHGITPGRPGATWNSLVQGYTTRKITYDHDRLPAVSSLATAFDSSGGQYLAGLWRNELPAGLLWQAKKDGPGRPSRHSTNPASSPPSWTWASIDGVRVDHDTTPLRSDVEIIEAEVYPSTSDPRGTVTGGYITLRGHLLKLQSTWERVDYKNFWLEHLVRISSDIRDDEDDKSTSCAGYLDRVTDKKLGFNEGALAGTIFFFLLGNVGGSEGAQPGKGLFLRELVDPTSEQVETGRRTMSKMLVERIGSAEIRESWRQKMYQSDAQIITIF